MKKLSANQIRQMWLDFFQEKNHHFLAPVSLIPVEDPSLLWINSGVATLKPYFEGRQTPPAPRLTNSQKAIRTNDIENVGVTARHQTMFEMLGNFSIGDYFKKEAILWAWELLTSPKWFGIPPQKLYITVFNEDLEAYQIWHEVLKIPEDHLFALGRETNFWDVGQGPCGPNTEIFFDRGQQWDPQNLGTRLLIDDLENDRYIEIWNVVFSQFNNDGQGNYSELPRKNIDTGAGLERLASIFQNTPTNFETDLFWPIIQKTLTFTQPGVIYDRSNYANPKPQQTKINTALKVIADHLRAVTFAIADGVFPGNKDRGYVLRRLLRRATTYGFNLGIQKAFLFQLVPEVVKIMGDFYPYLFEKQDLIVQTIKLEEEKFLKTLAKGSELLHKILIEEGQVSGKNAWLLFESFGFPIELTLEIAQQQGKPVALAGFQKLAKANQETARQARKDLKAWDKQSAFYLQLSTPSEFTGWEETKHSQAQVKLLFANEEVKSHLTDTQGFVILDQTPFYAEKGGQAGDVGILKGANGIAYVLDTQEGPHHQHIHQVKVLGTLKTGEFVDAIVDEEKRTLTMKNHSATHLLHWALRTVLGTNVMQAGSYNDEKGLRLDFTFHRPITNVELQQVEKLVQEKIAAQVPRKVYFCSLDEAIKVHQALAFFTEKYDQIVRVVQFGTFSSELCGGTHVTNTKEVEAFLITSLESKGNGLFRIKALTAYETVGTYLQTQFQDLLQQLELLANQYYQTKTWAVDPQLEKTLAQAQTLAMNKTNLPFLKTTLNTLKIQSKQHAKAVENQKIQKQIAPYLDLKPHLNSCGVAEIKYLETALNLTGLKQLADSLQNKYQELIVILGGHNADQNYLVVSVSPTLQTRFSALEIFQKLEGLQTSGGGNRSLAQGKYRCL